MINNKQKILISGVQPSGRIHIGNWVGALQNWVRLQTNPDYQCLFFIADYHSLSSDYDPAEKREQIFELMVDLLALGLDPEKCLLFRQSDILEHAELCWIFNTLTPMAFLERMTQFKDKSGEQEKNINVGLFDYPVLQAADILMYRGEFVPVGRDQVQHVELTRDIARFFNNKYGVQFFPEAKPLLTNVSKLRSLNDPLKKMSKSLGEKSYIALSDEPDVVLKKIKSMVTNTDGLITMTEKEIEDALTRPITKKGEEELCGQAGILNLITLLRLFGSAEEAEQVIANQPLKYGELKPLVAKRVSDYFAEFRERKTELMAKPHEVKEIFESGAERARALAAETMKEVREIIGITLKD
ncbi:tryptophan--tRNA ligase [Patescibacteria group bacterium]|nr:tryptophan--tRNA ligase [Patescibacteria group bacterium]